MGRDAHLAHTYVPIRFVIILIHFMFTLTVAMNPRDNVLAGIPWSKRQPYPNGGPGSEEYTATALLTTQLAVSLCLLVLEFALFIRPGYSILYPLVSLSSILLHGAGCWLTFFFLWEGWYYTFYAFILVTCVAIPAVIEISVAASQCFSEVELFRNIELRM